MAKNNFFDNDKVFTPFWNSNLLGTNSKKILLKKIYKHTFRMLKLFLYFFLILMGLWGCVQLIVEPWTSTNPKVGADLEFGFPYGTTGDWRYDLQSSGTQAYFIFTKWSFDYGPFYAFFVWPFAQMVLALMWGMRSLSYGFSALISIFILLLVIRVLTIFFSLNASLMTEKMSEVSGQIAEINAKYKNVNDPSLKRMRQLETMEIYKKNKIKPSAALTQAFVTIPIFLVILRIVNSMRPIKVTVLFGVWDLSVTPFSNIFQEFSNGGWVYIFFLLIVIPMQFLSFKLPQRWAEKRNWKNRVSSNKGMEQMKKNKRIQTILSVFFAIIVMTSATGVGVYWFLNSIFTLIQSYIIHVVILKRRKAKGEQSKLNKILEI